MAGGDARGRYGNKQAWQRVHRRLCGPLPGLCGQSIAFVPAARPASGCWSAPRA